MLGCEFQILQVRSSSGDQPAAHPLPRGHGDPGILRRDADVDPPEPYHGGVQRDQSAAGRLVPGCTFAQR